MCRKKLLTHTIDFIEPKTMTSQDRYHVTPPVPVGGSLTENENKAIDEKSFFSKMINEISRIYALCRKDGVVSVAERVVHSQKRMLQFFVYKKLYKNEQNWGIQGDIVMRNLIQLLGEEHKISSVIETGTYKGFTSSMFAQLFPNLPVYSCEIVLENYLEAKINTNKYKNVNIFNASSIDFLNKVVKGGLAGELPLFFLDAHWLDFWPLEDELKIIGSKLKRAIVIIDDFKVPGANRFEYDGYKGKECSVELVKLNLNKKNKYVLLLPKYNYDDAYRSGVSHHYWLVGHAVIFQNVSSIFSEKSVREFVDKYFEDKSYLVNNHLLKQ